MSQIKLIKQDVLNSLKHNLNESNINELIHEIEEKSSIDMNVQVSKKDYMW